jgi:hypothetical protein
MASDQELALTNGQMEIHIKGSSKRESSMGMGCSPMHLESSMRQYGRMVWLKRRKVKI